MKELLKSPFSEMPAVFTGGITAAQIFIGRESLDDDVYGIKTDKYFVNALEVNIHKRVSMDNLISYCAHVESSTLIKDSDLHSTNSDWRT
jgi:hypothetical protein